MDLDMPVMNGINVLMWSRVDDEGAGGDDGVGEFEFCSHSSLHSV